MTLQISSLNICTILVGIISNIIICAFWYSPLLFGNLWLKLIGKKMADISKAAAIKSMLLGIIPAALSIIFLALVLDFANATTLTDGLFIGSLVSVGFIGMNAVNLVLYEDRSFMLALLNVGYSFVALNTAAIILVLCK